MVNATLQQVVLVSPSRERSKEHTSPSVPPQWLSTSRSLIYAATVISAWICTHIYALWFLDALNRPGLGLAILLWQSWLSVGLFVTGHDCMHGSLAPGNPKLNRVVGELVLRLYFLFDYSKLYRMHHLHHKFAGTARDPDFDANHPSSFALWYSTFMITYVDLAFFCRVGAMVCVYTTLLGSRWPYVFVYYAFPALLSSLQLFYFGTFLPHRVDPEQPFDDDSRSRSSHFPQWLSLLTCFHFGYHSEHHNYPQVPWWSLPSVYQAQSQGALKTNKKQRSVWDSPGRRLNE